jgi:hypothetical protein
MGIKKGVNKSEETTTQNKAQDCLLAHTNIEDLTIEEITAKLTSQQEYEDLFNKLNEQFMLISTEMRELDTSREKVVNLMKNIHHKFNTADQQFTQNDIDDNSKEKQIDDDSDDSDTSESESDSTDESESEEEKPVEKKKSAPKQAAPKPAKKAPAKKAPTKKAPAKKALAKKAPTKK